MICERGCRNLKKMPKRRHNAWNQIHFDKKTEWLNFRDIWKLGSWQVRLHQELDSEWFAKEDAKTWKKCQRGDIMPEIRFTLTKKLNELILEVSNSLGVDKSDYIKSLIITELRKKQKWQEKNLILREKDWLLYLF